MITDTLHALKGRIKYLEIIVFGFINTSKGKGKKKPLLRKFAYSDIHHY